jgi:CHAT domain-containing protein
LSLSMQDANEPRRESWLGRLKGRPSALLLAALLFSATPSPAAISSCAALLESPQVVQEYHFTQHGLETRRIDLSLAAGQEWLIRIAERGIDVEATLGNPSGMGAALPGGEPNDVTRVDTPAERAGSMHALVSTITMSASSHATLMVTAKGPSTAFGTLDVEVKALSPTGGGRMQPRREACALAMRHWARADAAYATGRSIELAEAGAAETASATTAFDTAAQEYQAALDALVPAFEPGLREVAQLELIRAAVAYYELYHWGESARWAAKAAAAFANLRDPYSKARAEAILAAAWLELSSAVSVESRSSSHPSIAIPDDYQRRLADSRSLFVRLAAFHTRRREYYDAALQINNLGLSYYYDGHYESALPHLRRAQMDFERLGDTARLATALQNQALCEWGLGHLSSAVRLFDRALSLMQPTPRPNLYLLLLNNAGLAHYAAGEFDRALELQMQALDFATRTDSDRARARSFFGLGLAYYAIGDKDLAQRFLKSALDYCPGELDLRTRVPALRSLAVIEDESGTLASAIAHYTEALGLARSPSERARLLIRLARDYARQGDHARALAQLEEIIQPIEPAAPAGRVAHPLDAGLHDRDPLDHDPLTKAMALAERGRIHHAESRFDLARRDLGRALAIFERFDALPERFETEVDLARASKEAGDPSQALAQIRHALTLSEEIRTQTANPEYRSSIAETLRPGVDFLIALLREEFEHYVSLGDREQAQGIAAESLRVADESRARAFDDWRAERLESHETDTDPRVRSLLAARRSLYRDMAERRFQLAAREDHAGPDDPRVIALRGDIARLRARVGLLDAQLARAATATPRSGAGTNPAPPPPVDVAAATLASATPAQWRRALNDLPPDRIFVEYRLCSSEAFAWVVTHESVSWISLGSTSDVEEAAAHFHESMRLTAAVADRQQASAALYRLIVAPLAPQLLDHPNLVLIPDGALHYISFAALKDSSSDARDAVYLVQRYSIAIAPALRHFFMATESRRAPEQRMLLVADPVYSDQDPRFATRDSRGASRSASLPARYDSETLRSVNELTQPARLPATAREARSIASLYGTTRVDLLLGLDATRDNVLAKNLATYRFVHIASHGFMDSTVPQLSALVLARFGRQGRIADPYIRASDLLERDFRAQAVILTACDTSLGKAVAAEGIIGLRYAALARGARSVVASLWPVTDGITERLMTDMYRQMLLESADSQAVVEALSTAMRHALADAPSLDPALWAPFAVYVAGR